MFKLEQYFEIFRAESLFMWSNYFCILLKNNRAVSGSWQMDGVICEKVKRLYFAGCNTFADLFVILRGDMI